MSKYDSVTIPKTDSDVTLHVGAGQAGAGFYHLRLWSPKGNKILFEGKGTFLTSGDDDYTLPLKGKDLDGHFVESLATMSQIGGIKHWAHVVEVAAQGKRKESVVHTGKFKTGATVTDQIIIQLGYGS